MFRSKTFKILLSVAVSVGLILWIYFATDWTQVGEAFKNIKGRFWYLVPALALFMLHYVFRTIRWSYLLGIKTKFWARYNAIQFGNFTTYILPFRAGEFLRPFYLCKKADLPYPSTFISIVTERFFDLAMALVCFAVMLLVLDNVPSIIYVGAWSLSGLAVFIFLFIILAIFYSKILFWFLDKIKNICPQHIFKKLHIILISLIDGVKPLKNVKNFMMTTILTVVVWLSTVAFYYAFLFLFFDEPSLSLALAIVVCIAFAVAVPSAPGFVGVFQTGCVMAFALCGESKDLAVAYSIISHVSHYIIFMIYGGVLLLVSGVKLGDKKEAEKEAESELEIENL